MAENSKIEWTTHTWNPWEGCQKVSPGCQHCYAERRDQQYHGGAHWGPNGTRKMMSESYWKQPLKWNRDAAATGERPRVFCASLADVFEDRAELEAPRRRLFKLVQATPHLDWLLLTKRPENIHRLTYKAIDPFDDPDCEYNIAGEPNGLDVADFGELYPNIWLGTTVENQEQADKRIPELLKIPAKVRFLSCEPLLGAVDLSHFLPKLSKDQCPPRLLPYYNSHCALHWVIAGGESGPNARPAHPDWFRSLRNQCTAAGVAFHMKQMGSEWAKEKGRNDKKGGNWDEWPEEFKVREFPILEALNATY